MFRFELRYAVGGMVALFHDILLSIGFCGIMHIEISTSVVAALLTIFGYSIMDTIVIYDRIRENLRIVTTDEAYLHLVNRSINQSLTRTLLTSLLTLFAVLSLYVLGGDVINDFAVVMLFGVAIGTYSSNFIAPPFVNIWQSVSTKTSCPQEGVITV